MLRSVVAGSGVKSTGEFDLLYILYDCVFSATLIGQTSITWYWLRSFVCC